MVSPVPPRTLCEYAFTPETVDVSNTTPATLVAVTTLDNPGVLTTAEAMFTAVAVTLAPMAKTPGPWVAPLTIVNPPMLI